MCTENIISALLRATTNQIVLLLLLLFSNNMLLYTFRIVNVPNTSSEIGHVENKWVLRS